MILVAGANVLPVPQTILVHHIQCNTLTVSMEKYIWYSAILSLEFHDKVSFTWNIGSSVFQQNIAQAITLPQLAVNSTVNSAANTSAGEQCMHTLQPFSVKVQFLCSNIQIFLAMDIRQHYYCGMVQLYRQQKLICCVLWCISFTLIKSVICFTVAPLLTQNWWNVSYLFHW